MSNTETPLDTSDQLISPAPKRPNWLKITSTWSLLLLGMILVISQLKNRQTYDAQAKTDKAYSYVIFSRPPFSQDKIINTTVPQLEDKQYMRDKLVLIAAKNETESTTLAIHNQGTKTLQNIQLTLPSLSDDKGNIIEANNINLSLVKVLKKRNRRDSAPSDTRREPEVLLPYTPGWINQGEFDISPSQSKQWWITITIPKSQPPGVYKGTITITPTKGTVKTRSVELTVRDMTLQASPQKISGFYYLAENKYQDCYSNPCSDIDKFSFADKNTLPSFRTVVKKDFELFGEIGLQTITPNVTPILSWQDGHVQADLSFLQVIFEEMVNFGLANHPVAPFKTINNSVYSDIKNLIATNTSLSSNQIESQANADYQALLLQLDSLAKSNKIKIHYYPVDEPFGERPAEENLQLQQDLTKLSDLIRKTISPAQIWTTIHYKNWSSDSNLKAQYSPIINIYSFNRSITDSLPNYPKSTIVDFLNQDPKKRSAYAYLNFKENSSPLDHRIEHGLFLYYLPIKGNIPWQYQYLFEDPYNDLDGERADVTFAYPDPYDDGKPLPSLRLHAVREGIDDIRYLYTLEQAIKSSTNQTKKNEANDFLQSILDTIDSNPTVDGVKTAYPSQKLNELRNNIYDLISAL